MTPQKSIVGCLFGSFNPIHTGHLIIGEFMLSQSDIDTLEFVVSPQNPLKDPADLAEESHRLKMVELAIAGNPLMSANAIEFELSRPSYTIQTLRELQKARPDTEFRLIVGSDSLAHFIHWKEWEQILDAFECYTYMRPGFPPGELAHHPNVTVFKGPFLAISATYIRECLHDKYSIRYLVTPDVEDYINDNALYQDSR